MEVNDQKDIENIEFDVIDFIYYFIIDKYSTFDTIKNGNPTNITYDQKTDKKYH